MCVYCENEEILVSKTIEVSKDVMGTLVDYEDEYIVFIRGNTIRLGDKCDCQCIEAVGWSEIKYCPMCGKKLT